jgi:glycosyltransferase involved in cell wall biosynthesis
VFEANLNGSVMPNPQITVVTPIYNEEDCFDAFIRTIETTLSPHDEIDWRFLLIDDGSTDNSWALIEQKCATSPHFRGLRLSRNFGFHAALSAGIQHAEGDAIVTFPADLQEPAEVILEFIEAWKRGAEVVWAWRRTRDEPHWRVAASNLFAAIIRRFAMPPGSKFTTGSFFLIDRKVVECLRLMPEHNRVAFALVAWTGFRQEVVTYDRRRRYTGKSKYPLGKLLKTSFDTFVAYSRLLPRAVTVLGLFFSILGFALGAYAVIYWMLFATLPGWTGLIVTVATFSGVNFLILGTMTEYLHRIYLEATHRPAYFVAQDTAREGAQRPAEVHRLKAAHQQK